MITNHFIEPLTAVERYAPTQLETNEIGDANCTSTPLMENCTFYRKTKQNFGMSSHRTKLLRTEDQLCLSNNLLQETWPGELI